MSRNAWASSVLIAVPAALTLAACTAADPAAVGTAATAAAAEERRLAADLDRFIADSLRSLPRIPALSVAVARSSGPIFVRAYGEADRERHIAATPDTRFYIASSTKSFVALAFARLAARGEIDLDWTLAELAPDIAFAPELRAREVTLRHLLSHSHGLSGPAIEFRLAYSGDHDSATLWRLLGRLRPNPRAPLGTFAYGNLGYNIAAVLIGRRLGRSWQDIVEAEVLRPLRLRESMVRGLETTRARLSQPYASMAQGRPALLALRKSDATLQSAGGIYASAGDMARWIALQLAAARGRRGLPIDAAVVAGTHSPVVRMEQRFGAFARTGYGLGWYSGAYKGETLYHSFGGFVGARAHSSFLPSRDIGVAVMSNDEDVGFLFVDIAAAFVYDWFLEGPEAARRAGDEAVARLAGQAERQLASDAEDLAQRAARRWRLSLAPAAYRGRYCSEEFGTMAISGTGDSLSARIGLLESALEPFTEPESARIELIPNNGQSLEFVVENGAVTGLRTAGTSFRRC